MILVSLNIIDGSQIIYFDKYRSKFISASGATQVYMTYISEKHPTRSRTRKESTKIYKAKGANGDQLIKGFEETKL